MHVFPDLGTGSYKGMGIYHRIRIDVRPDVDIRWRHHYDRWSQIGPRPDGASSRNYPYPVLGSELPCRNGILVIETELSLRHVGKRPVSEPFQDHFLDPGIHPPFAVCLLCDPDLA